MLVPGTRLPNEGLIDHQRAEIGGTHGGTADFRCDIMPVVKEL